MKIIGITGKSGSGKSTLTALLSKELNCTSIDVDKIGHEATNDDKATEELCNLFGKEILGENKKVDRKKLGNIVFSSKEKMDKLTNITWGYMQEKIDEILEKKHEIIILDWALLPISKYWENCHIKILTMSEQNERKIRVIERDRISEEYFEKRDSTSLDYKNLEFNYIYKNNYKNESMEKLVKIVSKQIQKMKK